MDIEWNTKVINSQNLIEISRGDPKRLLKYLQQFQDLIPKRIIRLKESLKAEDRTMIRKLLHQMSPQLQFFGIPGIKIVVRRLELEYETIPLETLNGLVQNTLRTLEEACKEVDWVLKTNFGK